MYLGLLLLLVDIGIYFLDTRAGFLLTCFLVFYFAMILYLMLYNRPIIINELVSFATQYGQIQKELLRELSVPYSLLDEDGKKILERLMDNRSELESQQILEGFKDGFRLGVQLTAAGLENKNKL